MTTARAQLEALMQRALEEARASLREGERGFGAVVARDGELLAACHDRERAAGDPTAHAEIAAIRAAASALGGSLRGCTLVATHEPCPMCAAAIVWSGVSELAFGYSIERALAAGRRRIPLGCRELFDRAGAGVRVHEGVLVESCAPLYDGAVREQVRRLRDAGPAELAAFERDSIGHRLEWFETEGRHLELPGASPLERGYALFLAYLGLEPGEAPVVAREPRRLVIHSRNRCPTLEACRILGRDTREVCGAGTERPMAALLARLDPRLRFGRSYERIRPHAPYCEEWIELGDESP